MSEELGLSFKMAAEGIRAFGKAIERTMISVVRWFDAAVDGGAEPPPGYWEPRLRREIKRRSIRGRSERMVATIVAKVRSLG